MHSIIVGIAAYPHLVAWARPWALDLPNTPPQVLLLQFSLAYLLVDTAYAAAFTDDYIIMAHHAVAATYVTIVLALGVGGISAVLTFFLGELTTPLLNVFSVTKELKGERAWAAKVFEAVSPVFTAFFLLVRSIVGPPIMAWFVRQMWFRSPGLPPAASAALGGMVAFGTAGSQLWAYRLWRGYRKSRRVAKGKKTA